MIHINNFKAFFSWLKQDKNQLFKNLPCYQQMIHLINMHQLALHALHVALMKGQRSQYLWVDSTTLPVCKNQRIQRHKSLAKIASRGKSSMGWFYGCKLHITMNQLGEIAFLHHIKNARHCLLFVSLNLIPSIPAR